MRNFKQSAFLVSAAIGSLALLAQAPPPGSTRQLPDGPGRDITQKVCGATCHGPDIIMGSGRTRDQWTSVVNQMVARGAKATDAELVQIADYLASRLGPNMVAPAPPSRGGSTTGRGPGPLGAGAADSHVVDTKAADRGKTVYIAECITCHGNKARGGNSNLPPNQQGADLVRSLVVLHDRYGSEIGPFLTKGHPMQSGKPAASLTRDQIADLSHFLHQRVYYTLRGGPELEDSECADRRSESRRGLLQRRGQMQQLPFAYGRSRGHRPQVRSAHPAVEVPVSRERSGSAAAGSWPGRSSR